MMKLLILLLLFTGANIAFSQVEIIKNLDSDTDPQVPFTNPGSTPTFLTQAGTSLYFVASDGLYGRELWKSDGSGAGTVRVKNINPSGNSNITGLFNFNGILVFQANDGVNGNELWRSDGTAAGTYMIKDLTPGEEGSFIQNLIVNKTDLLFFGSVGSNGESYGLWKSNGTDEGTVLLKTIDITSDPMITINNITYFTGYGEYYKDLWRTDGTADGTYKVKDLGGDYYNKSYLTDVNGTLFFTSLNINYENELWKSDGTANGTQIVKTLPYTYTLISELTAFNGQLFFSGDDRELWKSDGTSAGTQIVKKINANGSSLVRNLTVSNGSLFFAAEETSNLELFKTDGTSNGTVKVVNLNPSKLTSYGNNLFFTSNSGVQGIELYKTDGTENGTLIVKDIRLNGSSSPNYLTAFNNTLFFSANDGINGIELWSSNGTDEETRIVKNINNTLPEAVANGLYYNNNFFFVKTTPSTGAELWKSDGTESGTIVLKDIYPGSVGSFPGNFKVFNNEVYFTAFHPDYGVELWKTNGTTMSTVMVKDVYPGQTGSTPFNLTVLNNILVFTAENDVNGQELWKTDGTTNGTTLVKDIFQGIASSGIQNMTVLNNLLFFAATDNTTGAELWKSDGTSAGTMRVKDINTTVETIITGGGYGGGGTTTTVPGSSNPADLTVVGDILFFSANDGINGIELWRTDGTQGGTYLIKDVYQGNSSSWPRKFTATGGTLFFAAYNSNSEELWKSDGTAAGTVLIKGMESYNPKYINNKLFFISSTPETGYELWVSDGTSAGTKMVLDANPGTGSSNPENYFWFNGSVHFFTAGDQNFYKKLWKTNGTTEGTILVSEFNSIVTDYKIVNDELFIVGINNGANGLLKLDKQSGQLLPLYSSSSSEKNPYALTTFNEKALYFLHNENLLRIRADFEINIVNVGPLEVNEQVNLVTVVPGISGIDFIVLQGPGTIQGTTLQANAVGDIMVKAIYPGDNTFKPAEKIFTIAVVETSNKIDQTILISKVSNKTFGDDSFTISAMGGGSGNPVIFTVASGPATATGINGATITITGAGVVQLKASQAGNENYKAAPDVTTEFTVSKASQTIIFNNPGDHSYGVAPFELIATGGQSGNPVTFEILEGPATLLDNFLSITGTGVIKIRASQAGNENYENAIETVKQFSVGKSMATIALSTTNVIYDGTAKEIIITTTPPGLSFDLKYNGSPAKPVNAGIYDIVAVITDPNYEGTTSGTLTIKKAMAEIILSSATTFTYDGSPKAIIVATQPSNLPITIKYNESSNPPVNAGDYTFKVDVTDPNYEGTVSGTFTIKKALAELTIANETIIFNGSPKTVTAITKPANLPVTIKYNGSNIPPVNAGIYKVNATINIENYEIKESEGTLTIAKAATLISFDNLQTTYDGKTKRAGVSTVPTNLKTNIVYESETEPVNAGVYKVVATIEDVNYQGSASETLVIKKSAQRIDFTQVPEKSNLSDPFSVNAISSSGLPLTLSIISGPASINGNVITLTKEAGTINVEAFQSGNNNYLEARAVITINVKLDLVLGAEDMSKEIFRMWPMPANSNLTVKTDGQEIKKLTLMNTVGEMLTEMESISSEAIMDLTSFPSGNYFLMIITENNRFVKKIMIVR